ncbi:MAG: MFS transporter, partial [Acidimicrobiales bacterium]
MPGISRSARLLEPRHWYLLGLLGATSFFDGYDRNIVIVALPQLRASFHLSQSRASLWISLLYLGALPALFLARRADIAGRRRLLMFTVSGFTIATAATSVAPTILSFALCQFAAQAFLTAETAVVWTMVAEELPAGARGVGFGWLALLNALGTGLCALIYATALSPQGLSWRWLYIGATPVLIAVIVLRRRLPESRRFNVASAAGLANANWRRIVRPPLRRRLALAAAATLLAGLTQQAIVFVVDFMETQRHQSASAANLILVAAGAIALPALLISGALSDRLGRRPVACGFLVLSVVGPMWLFLFAHGTFPLLAALGLTYVGSFGAWPTLGAF